MADPIPDLKLSSEAAEKIHAAALNAFKQQHAGEYLFLQNPKGDTCKTVAKLLKHYIGYRIGRLKTDTLSETAEGELRSYFRHNIDKLVQDIHVAADVAIEAYVKDLVPAEKEQAEAAYREAQGPRARKASIRQDPPAAGRG